MKNLFNLGTFVMCLGLAPACMSTAQRKSQVSDLAAKGYRPWVEGHRGARAVLPENTLPAFDYALAQGVDVLEMDLGVTRDGVLVVSHDPVLNPLICLGPKGLPLLKKVIIHELSYQELTEYDCGSLKNPKFPKQKPTGKTAIPRLKDVFELVRKSSHPAAREVRFNIETKIDPKKPNLTVGPEDFASLVVDEFKASGFGDRLLLQSFDFRTLEAARRLNPLIRTSMLVDYRANNEKYFEQAEALKVNVFSPNFALLNKDLVAGFQDRSMKVVPWTLNSEEDWDQALIMKVDGIITDDPEALITYLKNQGLR